MAVSVFSDMCAKFYVCAQEKRYKQGKSLNFLACVAQRYLRQHTHTRMKIKRKKEKSLKLPSLMYVCLFFIYQKTQTNTIRASMHQFLHVFTKYDDCYCFIVHLSFMPSFCLQKKKKERKVTRVTDFLWMNVSFSFMKVGLL